VRMNFVQIAADINGSTGTFCEVIVGKSGRCRTLGLECELSF
jgi:hypothetical protein